MKQRFWLFRRGEMFGIQDTQTGKRESLHTKDRKQAERLVAARNEVAVVPMLGLTLGRAYLAAYDSAIPERTWQNVMDEFCNRGKPSTRTRRQRALRGKAFEKLRSRKLVETTADELRAVMAAGGVFTNHFMRCLHNLAVGYGWLPWGLIPPKLWPRAEEKSHRGITEAEYRKVIEAEKNEERRLYYELLWEIGAAQTDGVELTHENIDWQTRVLAYQRCKTGEWAELMIGPLMLALRSLSRQIQKDNPTPRNKPSNDSQPKKEPVLFNLEPEFYGTDLVLRDFFYGYVRPGKKEDPVETMFEDIAKSLEAGKTVVSATFVIPYPPGFPILIPGQQIKKEDIKYLDGLGDSEIHGIMKSGYLNVWTVQT